MAGLRALGVVRVCAPPEFAELQARVGVPAAAAEVCGVLVATSVMPAGVWL
jgi:hypothetical protein